MTLLGETLQVLGEILLGISVIRVHWRVFNEHKIDGIVLKAIKRERTIAVIAIVFLVGGYLLRVL